MSLNVRIFIVARVLLLLAILMAGITAPVKADVYQNRDVRIVNFGFPEYVSCANGRTGEWIDFEGTAVIIDMFHLTPAGRAYDKYQVSLQGLKGVGSVTGDVYTAVGVSNEVTTGTFFDDSQLVRTALFNFNVVGPGEGNNYRFHGIIHFTRLDGDYYVSEVEVIKETCQ